MHHRIRKPTILIAVIVLAQLACLAAGVFAFSAWMRSTISQIVYQQVLDDNVQTARQITTLINQMDPNDLRENPETWKRLQNVIGHIELPNNGFVCLTDTHSGKVLFHPDFNGLDGPMDKQYPELVGEESLVTDVPATARAPAVNGSVHEQMGELQIIAAANVQGVDLRINVHQRTAGVEERIDRLMQPIGPIGIIISVFLVAFTSGAIALIVRRYDDHLAQINHGLEETVERRTRSLLKTRDAVVFGLAKLADSRDPDTGEHLERIRGYVTLLARQLKKQHAPQIDGPYIENLALASSLHDIGKVGISDAVLLKRGSLTPRNGPRSRSTPSSATPAWKPSAANWAKTTSSSSPARSPGVTTKSGTAADTPWDGAVTRSPSPPASSPSPTSTTPCARVGPTKNP